MVYISIQQNTYLVTFISSILLNWYSSRRTIQGLFYLQKLTLIPSGISNHILDEMLNEIIYPFPNLKGPQSPTAAPFKFGNEMKTYFHSTFIIDAITYL